MRKTPSKGSKRNATRLGTTRTINIKIEVAISVSIIVFATPSLSAIRPTAYLPHIPPKAVANTPDAAHSIVIPFSIIKNATNVRKPVRVIESMVAITTDKINVQNWRDLDREDITMVNIRGNFSVSVVKEKLPKPKRLLVDTHADTIRAIAQGRADALVENPGWLLSFMDKFENINWRVLDEPIFTSYCGIGVGKGNENLRQYLNVLLYDLHSSGTINEIWEKWYEGPMAIPVNENPYF